MTTEFRPNKTLTDIINGYQLKGVLSEAQEIFGKDVMEEADEILDGKRKSNSFEGLTDKVTQLQVLQGAKTMHRKAQSSAFQKLLYDGQSMLYSIAGIGKERIDPEHIDEQIRDSIWEVQRSSRYVQQESATISVTLKKELEQVVIPDYVKNLRVRDDARDKMRILSSDIKDLEHHMQDITKGDEVYATAFMTDMAIRQQMNQIRFQEGSANSHLISRQDEMEGLKASINLIEGTYWVVKNIDDYCEISMQRDEYETPLVGYVMASASGAEGLYSATEALDQVRQDRQITMLDAMKRLGAVADNVKTDKIESYSNQMNSYVGDVTKFTSQILNTQRQTVERMLKSKAS